MPYINWILLSGLAGIGVWQFAVWQGEVRTKKEKYRDALTFARTRNKPLLIAGGPYGHRRMRRVLNMPAHGGGDVCLDIDRNAVEGHPKAVIASVTNIPFSDKSFGAVFASHLLEHLPTTDEAAQALNEFSRIADGVFVASPTRQSFSGWLHPDHHLWVWQDERTTFVEQRGKLKEEMARTKSFPITTTGLTIEEEAELEGRRLFPGNGRKRREFIKHMLSVCRRVEGKEFLVIHNPGGWGGTVLPDLLGWERSVIDGVNGFLDQAGYSHLLVQHFRGGASQLAHVQNAWEQTYFMVTGQWNLVGEMAAELEFYTRHFPDLKIILLGASQGAAFGNAVMKQVNAVPQIFGIELGFIFVHARRRFFSERILRLDGNGEMPDPIVRLNLRVAGKAYLTAPYRWLKYRLEGHPRKFSYCINAPGHDYNWKYPGVHQKIEEFLQVNFGKKEVGG